MSLPPGLYERLINEILARQLAADPRHHHKDSLDPHRAPNTLARYVAAAVEHALAGMEDDDPRALVNRVIDLLASQPGLEHLRDWRIPETTVTISRSAVVPMCDRNSSVNRVRPLEDFA